MQSQITEKVTPWINAAVEEHGQGEDISWEPSLIPGNNGEAVYTIFFWLPGAVLGSVAHGSITIGNPMGLTQEGINGVVAKFLHDLREARSRDIEARAPQPSAPLPPGMHPSGLILPGR